MSKKGINKTHGMWGSKIYSARNTMKTRCNSKNHKYYHRYGGRGITYCDKWETFEGFYEDMKEGYSDNLTLDRRDNDGNYCKSNCRWATMKTQSRNRKSTLLYKGVCGKDWCKKLNLNYSTFSSRVRRGKTIEQALFFK